MKLKIMPKDITNTKKNGFSFSKEDGLRAALAVIPSIILILLGNLNFGIALAIGTLPTLQLGIAPKRKQRIAFSILGCLFGLGIFIGSYIALIESIWIVGIVFFVVALLSAIIASKKPIGAILLALILPAMTVGSGFDRDTAFSLTIAFILGSLWSGIVALIWPEEDKEMNNDGMKSFVAKNPKQYGVLLGLAAVTAIFYGYFISPDFLAWTATAAMLTMRPFTDMVKTRGFWRATATVVGGILAVITITMQLPNVITAALVLIIMVLIIGTSKSGWWLMPLGTAFFILTLSLLGETDSTEIKIAGWERITDNVVGAGIALFYGLLVPVLFKRHSEKEKTIS